MRGYDGASTRALADAAGVNLGAIQYHFGGKKALYLAAADHIAGTVAILVDAHLEKAEQVLKNPAATQEELFDTFAQILDGFAERMLAHDDAKLVARFIFHEQIDATEGFDRLYEGAMERVNRVCSSIVARLRGETEVNEETQARTFAIIGQLIIFGASRGMVMRTFGWDKMGERELSLIQRVIRDQTRAALGLAP